MNVGTKVARLGFSLRYISMAVLLMALISRKEPAFPDESVAEKARPLGDEMPTACATASMVSGCPSSFIQIFEPSSLRLCRSINRARKALCASSCLCLITSSGRDASFDGVMLKDNWSNSRLTSDSDRTWIMIEWPSGASMLSLLLQEISSPARSKAVE